MEEREEYTNKARMITEERLNEGIIIDGVLMTIREASKGGYLELVISKRTGDISGWYFTDKAETIAFPPPPSSQQHQRKTQRYEQLQRSTR
jgi:hypothetical protein